MYKEVAVNFGGNKSEELGNIDVCDTCKEEEGR